jgi:hypothetical protein
VIVDGLATVFLPECLDLLVHEVGSSAQPSRAVRWVGHHGLHGRDGSQGR